jgi:hypothetical protein
VIAGGDPHARNRTRNGPSAEKLPLEARIRRRAYELYLRRGNQAGSELDDWLQAEDEIRGAEEEALDKR